MINRGDENFMKEFFSWHSTLKSEDSFPAKDGATTSRQDTEDAGPACFTPKEINIYVHILEVPRQCVLLLQKKTLFKRITSAPPAREWKRFSEAPLKAATL